MRFATESFQGFKRLFLGMWFTNDFSRKKTKVSAEMIMAFLYLGATASAFPRDKNFASSPGDRGKVMSSW